MAKSKPTPKPTLKFPDRKISDTFLQFSNPLLEEFGPSLTEEQMEKTLIITWTVWNAVVHADVAGNEEVLDRLRASTEHDAQIKECVEFLIHRKRMAFDDDQRLIGEYQLYRKDGGVRLRAVAHDPTATKF